MVDTLCITPLPRRVVLSDDVFIPGKNVAIHYHSSLGNEKDYLADFLSKDIKIRVISNAKSAILSHYSGISLSINTLISGEEGYRLSINTDRVLLEGKTAAGVFYGIQSLRQLLVAAKLKKDLKLQGMVVEDEPRLEYRGFMLDSVRRFQKVAVIKKYLDLMALYKMNRFHWHLTDDEAWRIEIKKYPKLTSVGAFPRSTHPKGMETDGYYSQTEMREIVQYAHARHIKVIPELDVPGHANALLVAYPELMCDQYINPDDPQHIQVDRTGIFPFKKHDSSNRYPVCAGKDSVIEFLGNVLSEMYPIFDDGIIHIGGDERPQDHWPKCASCKKRMKDENLKDEDALQSWFLDELSKKLFQNGFLSMSWAETKFTLSKNQIAQAWRDEGRVYSSNGFQTVNSYNPYTYLDYPQHAKRSLELFEEWMRDLRLPTKKVYSYNPVPEGLTSEQEKMYGFEAPVWTETILMDRLDAMVFPRLIAIAEGGWTLQGDRDWKSFSHRFNNSQQDILKFYDVDYDDLDTMP